MSETVIQPRPNVYECSNPLHDFCEQNTSWQDPFVIPYLSVSDLGKYILRLENKNSSGLDGISNQLHVRKLSVPYVRDSLTYVFNLCIEKNIFPSELKKAKVFRFQNLRIKQIQPVTDQYHFCLFCQSFSKNVHIYDYLEKRQLFHPFHLGLDVNTRATLHWHVSQILG